MEAIPGRGYSWAMADPIVNHRYYLWGREAAEDRFEGKDFDVKQMAQQVLDGADLRDTLKAAVDAQMAMDNYDGSLSEFIEEYDDALIRHLGVGGRGAVALENLRTAYRSQASELWAQWQRGFRDEATMALEDDVVDQMHEIVVDQEENDPHSPAVGVGYGAYVRDGKKDAVSSWEDGPMGDYIGQLTMKIREVRHPTPEKIRELSLEVAELAQVDWENEGCKDQWMKANARDALDDDLDPEVAYRDFWRPAFVNETAAILTERALR